MKKIEKMKLTKLQKRKLQPREMQWVRGGNVPCACGGICFGSISTDFGDGWATGNAHG